MSESYVLSLHRRTATCGCTDEGPGNDCETGQHLFQLVSQAYVQASGAPPREHVPWSIYETHRARYYAHLGEMANYLDMLSNFATFSPEKIADHTGHPILVLPPGHYVAVGGNHSLYVRYYADPSRGTDCWSVELVIDYDTHDHSLTFGPLAGTEVSAMVEVLQRTYCTIYENWDGPLYMADQIRLQEEKDAEDANPAQRQEAESGTAEKQKAEGSKRV